MTIRRATPADLPALHDLHLANWREAYRELLPDSALQEAAARYLADRWGPGALARDSVLVCPAAKGGLAGFVAFRQDESEGIFVDNLHVGAASRVEGLARMLMTAVARDAGARPVWLTVLDGNLRARAVYRRWNGVESAPFAADFLGITLHDRRVDWPSGRALLRALGGVDA